MDHNSPQNTLILPSSILKTSSQSNPPSPTFHTIESPADSNLDIAETTSRSIGSSTISLSRKYALASGSIGSSTIRRSREYALASRSIGSSSFFHEYALAVHTESFKDIHSHSPNELQEKENNNQNKFRPSSSGNHGYSQRARFTSPPSLIPSLPHEHSLAFLTNGENHNNHQNQAEPCSDFVSQPFQPFREDVKSTLNGVTLTNLTRFASAYFDHSERTSHLLCILLESISQARSLYTPPHSLLNSLSLHSPLSHQVNLASNVFLQFNIHENPFPLRISQNFQDIILCVSALNQQLPSRLIWNSSSSLCDLILRPSSLYDLIVRGSRVHNGISSSFLRDLIVRGSSILKDDVNIIDRLVTQLQAVIESDKLMVRIGLERGKDRYPLQEMMERVRKNRTYFLDNLLELESHIYLCFWTLNKVRSSLLSAIQLHEKTRSRAHESSQAVLTIEENHNNNQSQDIPSFQALKEVLERLKLTDFRQLLDAFNLYPFSQSIKKARLLYTPLYDLISNLPLDSPLSQSQCDQAVDVILQLNLLENPLDSCISQTLTELDELFDSLKLNSISLRVEEHYIAAYQGYSELQRDLHKIETHVTQLQLTVKRVGKLIRFSLENTDRYSSIKYVIEELGKKLPILSTQFMDLEECVCYCSATVNRFSSLFLLDILLQKRL